MVARRGHYRPRDTRPFKRFLQLASGSHGQWKILLGNTNTFPLEVCGQTINAGEKEHSIFSHLHVPGSYPDHATCLSKGFWEDDEDRDPRHQLVHVLGLGLL